MEVSSGKAADQKPYVLKGIVKETPDVWVFSFAAQDGSTMSFDPGMFVMLTYVDKVTNERITRAFSIASAPNAETLDFFIHMVHGKMTSKLENTAVGDVYYVTGPHGQFKFMASEQKKVLFIAGGTGLAPFMSMLRQIEGEHLGTDVALIYSVRYPNEIIRSAELESMVKGLGMKLFITVTRPDGKDSWPGEKGHIDEAMVRRCVPDAAERTAYVCGPLNFVKAMKDVLACSGVKPEKVKADVWG